MHKSYYDLILFDYITDQPRNRNRPYTPYSYLYDFLVREFGNLDKEICDICPHISRASAGRVNGRPQFIGSGAASRNFINLQSGISGEILCCFDKKSLGISAVLDFFLVEVTVPENFVIQFISKSQFLIRFKKRIRNLGFEMNCSLKNKTVVISLGSVIW